MNNEEFLEEIKKLLDLKNEIKGKIFNFNGKDLKPLIEIVENYVFTADNFIKMVLILLRIRANIPVIMMGETGCGKTSLIRIIAELKNNKMKILNIHAGITDKEIIDFMEGNSKYNDINLIGEGFIEEERLLTKEEKKEREEKKIVKLQVKKLNKSNEDYPLIWVFLDEINTCNSMGLISEIMCKHTMYGKKI